jgi:hypothetical protein
MAARRYLRSEAFVPRSRQPACPAGLSAAADVLGRTPPAGSGAPRPSRPRGWYQKSRREFSRALATARAFSLPWGRARSMAGDLGLLELDVAQLVAVGARAGHDDPPGLAALVLGEVGGQVVPEAAAGVLVRSFGCPGRSSSAAAPASPRRRPGSSQAIAPAAPISTWPAQIGDGLTGRSSDAGVRWAAWYTVGSTKEKRPAAPQGPPTARL